MKKTYIVALAMAAMAVGCTERGDGEVEFDTVTVDRQVKLADEAGSPQCTVHLELCQAKADQGHRAEAINEAVVKRVFDYERLGVKEAADSFANKYTADYREHFLPLYREDKADSTKRSWYEYHYVVTTNTQQGKAGVVNYDITIDYYEGGAHGLNQRLVMNFDTKTGRQYTLADIFTSGYERLLGSILLKALREKTGAKSLDELHEQGYLYSMDMFAPENFVMDEETITFVYNPYEIAPYALGKTELTIAWSALEKILQK